MAYAYYHAAVLYFDRNIRRLHDYQLVVARSAWATHPQVHTRWWVRLSHHLRFGHPLDGFQGHGLHSVAVIVHLLPLNLATSPAHMCVFRLMAVTVSSVSVCCHVHVLHFWFLKEMPSMMRSLLRWDTAIFCSVDCSVPRCHYCRPSQVGRHRVTERSESSLWLDMRCTFSCSLLLEWRVWLGTQSLSRSRRYGGCFAVKI